MKQYKCGQCGNKIPEGKEMYPCDECGCNYIVDDIEGEL